jgi:prepilin peptidase CpaA
MNPFDRPLISVANWPILVICVGMLAAAIIDWWKFKVPNKLTYPLIFSGWLLGLANNFGLEAGDGGIGAALVGTALGFALLLPVYAIGGMGAGDVKMTMGFGSWIGAFYGINTGADIIFWAFCSGVIVGGIIGLGMILARGQFQQNAQHLREIVSDMFRSSGIGDIANKANNRRPRWHRLPYGVPLCIGFLGYLAYIYNFNLLMVP